MFNTWCFSTATMVVRTHLNVTLYVHCPSCLSESQILSVAYWGGGFGGFKPPPEIPKISVESSITWARRTGVSISFCSSVFSYGCNLL